MRALQDSCEILTCSVNHPARPRNLKVTRPQIRYAELSPNSSSACECMCVRATPCAPRLILGSSSVFRAPPARSSRFAHVWRQIRPLFLLLPSSLPPSLPPHYTHLTIIRQGGRPLAPALRSQLWRAFHAVIFLGESCRSRSRGRSASEDKLGCAEAEAYQSLRQTETRRDFLCTTSRRETRPFFGRRTF